MKLQNLLVVLNIQKHIKVLLQTDDTYEIRYRVSKQEKDGDDTVVTTGTLLQNVSRSFFLFRTCYISNFIL